MPPSGTRAAERDVLSVLEPPGAPCELEALGLSGDTALAQTLKDKKERREVSGRGFGQRLDRRERRLLMRHPRYTRLEGGE